MTDDLIQRIQQLQFSDRDRAETLALEFIRSVFPLDVVSVELRPLAVSLNSFNGYATLADGKRLFFKAHTESDTVIDEYYQASLLAEAGYPIVEPLYASTRRGQQILIYDLISDPSVFDLAWGIETGREPHTSVHALTEAQQRADTLLAGLYAHTLKSVSAEDHARAPVHQLFYHRLTGGRLMRFYGPLPGMAGRYDVMAFGDRQFSWDTIRSVQWRINGQRYHESLDEIIQRSVRLLDPAQSGPSVIGHGDAHNGNVFFRQHSDPPHLQYFDPAFAGRHDPLLDLTKPLFHNVFAMWMYFRSEIDERLNITLEPTDDLWIVEHDYKLHPIRDMFLMSKVERVLIPTLTLLKSSGLLRNDWRAYLKSALFCCPFLTMNLADSSKFPWRVSLLGLSMAVEMGSESEGERSLIDRILDDVERAIR
ncbi:MAG: phosphotransferase [Candidatus Flexifilum sp.]